MPEFLKTLEAEAIHAMREVAAEFRKPVLLYSGGKDSSVMLHLAMKAFYPAKPPFPLLMIETGWEFRELVAFRDAEVAQSGFDLIVHTNPAGVREAIDPISGDEAVYTRVMKTEALGQAFEAYGFDAGLAGARRDEEVSRAKERVLSFRNSRHAWDPRNQRPEIWRLYNTRLHAGESFRAFPLSNWTEIDVWHYIRQEGIAVAPLYFAAERPVVERSGRFIMVDDDRLPLEPGEVPASRHVRFRSVGCYPLTAACQSLAVDVDKVIAEMSGIRISERHGRLGEGYRSVPLEKRKREGYF